MSGKADGKGRFLEPEEVTELTDEQKDYMLKQGFKPYLTRHGRIKWITPGQHGYRSLHASASGYMHRSVFSRLFSTRSGQILGLLFLLLAIAGTLYLAIALI